MEKVIVISDIHTELGFNLFKIYYANGYRIIGISNTESRELPFNQFNEEFVEIVHWNRISPIGVKNILLKGIARFKKIDEVIILQTADFKSSKIHQIPIIDFDRNIDMWIKGNCYLLKEIVDYLLKCSSGMITLVNNIIFKDEPSLIGEILEASFQAVVKNLLKSAKDSQLVINGIESDTILFDKFSEYIFNTINEKGTKSSGKMFYFHEKRSFLAGLRNS